MTYTVVRKGTFIFPRIFTIQCIMFLVLVLFIRVLQSLYKGIRYIWVCVLIIVVERQAISLERYGARYIRWLSCRQHSQRSGSSSQSCSDQQEHQVQPAIQHSCSLRWPLRQGVHGTISRWNWYRRLEDGRSTLQVMPGSPPSCFSSCPWHYREGNAVSFQNTFTAN